MAAHSTSYPEEQDDPIAIPNEIWPPMMRFMAPVPLSPNIKKTQGKNKVCSGVKVQTGGDLLDGCCDIVIQCCNCLDHMGAGIARTIKNKFPNCYDEYLSV